LACPIDEAGIILVAMNGSIDAMRARSPEQDEGSRPLAESNGLALYLDD
jgi:hypothetical protein